MIDFSAWGEGPRAQQLWEGLASPCRTKLWSVTSACVCGGFRDHHRETAALVQRDSHLCGMKAGFCSADGFPLELQACCWRCQSSLNVHQWELSPQPLVCHKMKARTEVQSRSLVFIFILPLQSVFIEDVNTFISLDRRYEHFLFLFNRP